ncbi:hypothetical protein BGZ46_005534 [Entomortierella lignicola]|nr:hypothetical protein BGZ46_005534 [Entomortierella lignicola]
MSYPNHNPEKQVPAVMIVGAGIGGLMLGALLEQINIPYHIFERTATVRPLGSTMGLGTSTLPIFEQLGLLDEFKKFSLPFRSMEIYDDELKKLGDVSVDFREIGGYDNMLFARPKLYEILLSRVPSDKISFNKKVLKSEEKEGKVTIHCSDNTSYDGDIIVGADGAYSGVRQSLYKRLDEMGVLPKSDMEELNIGHVAVLGIAVPEDTEKYPQLKDNLAHCAGVIGPNNKSWQAISIGCNQIAWTLRLALTPKEAKELQFRNSEWGPESNDKMAKEYEHLPCPFGGTMGELIEITPKSKISKIFLEEKLFKTWYHGQTVLIGDAAHKMLPWGGQGAANAIQDAVVLANCLYFMQDASPKSIEAAFQDYYAQRFHRADIQNQHSRTSGKITNGQSPLQKLARKLIFNYLPDWVKQRSYVKALEYRPQIAWLPLVENRGTGKVVPQELPRSAKTKAKSV